MLAAALLGLKLPRFRFTIIALTAIPLTIFIVQMFPPFDLHSPCSVRQRTRSRGAGAHHLHPSRSPHDIKYPVAIVEAEGNGPETIRHHDSDEMVAFLADNNLERHLRRRDETRSCLSTV